MLRFRPLRGYLLLVCLASSFSFASSALAEDPLPSWNDVASKRALVSFVERVTKVDSPDFVPVEQRIATFDNDGTLWAEQPIYFQGAFVITRMKHMLATNPAWKTKPPFAAALSGNYSNLLFAGEAGIVELVMATHAGMTTEEFEEIVVDWIATARHPTKDRLYRDMVYQPMLELLAYLRANDFKTYIVSGGGVEFMRPWTEKRYGIPPEQVIGSSIKTQYELRNNRPVLMRLPEIAFIDNGAGKPVGIQNQIGRRPILAFGNSDGDYEMLRWATAGKGPRLGLIVHHTDAVREWAYDRDSHVGRLDRALQEAPEWKWVVVNMKDDWAVIFPPEK
jgi:phosphoglycolate phosphatase-like HAD superfamily hydrolase